MSVAKLCHSGCNAWQISSRPNGQDGEYPPPSGQRWSCVAPPWRSRRQPKIRARLLEAPPKLRGRREQKLIPTLWHTVQKLPKQLSHHRRPDLHRLIRASLRVGQANVHPALYLPSPRHSGELPYAQVAIECEEGAHPTGPTTGHSHSCRDYHCQIIGKQRVGNRRD